jgi:hypothetical protein
MFLEPQKKEPSYFILRGRFELLAQQFLEGSINRDKFLSELGIEKEDFFGPMGEDVWDHLNKSLCRQDTSKNPRQLDFKAAERHIRQYGRFDSDPEPIKVLTPEERRRKILQDMEKALRNGNQAEFDKFSLALAKEHEEEVLGLRRKAGEPSDWDKIY